MENHLTSKEDFQPEFDYCLSQLEKWTENESIWNYINGWFKQHTLKVFKPTDELQEKGLKFTYNQFPKFEEICRASTLESPNRFAYSSLVNILLEKQTKESIAESLLICEKLKESDKIRIIYWSWMKEQILEDFKEILKE